MLSLPVPVTVRHFRSASGRLLATIAATKMNNNLVAVGIARCNKKDRPSRAKGRDLAMDRLSLGLFPQTEMDRMIAAADVKLNAFKIMPEEQYNELLASHPFNKWGCPFGVTAEELKLLRKSAKNTKNVKKKKKQPKGC